MERPCVPAKDDIYRNKLPAAVARKPLLPYEISEEELSALEEATGGKRVRSLFGRVFGNNNGVAVR
jgi:hypothetical protein